jgi:hypothetical protein
LTCADVGEVTALGAGFSLKVDASKKGWGGERSAAASMGGRERKGNERDLANVVTGGSDHDYVLVGR